MLRPAPSVLVIDDNAVDREHVRRLLGSACTVREAATARDGISAMARGSIDCVLLDYRLPDGDGVEVIEELTKFAIPVLMLTSQGSESVAVEAMKRGATDYLVKATLSRDTLGRAVTAAIDRARLARELAARTEELERINATLAERESRLRVLLQQLPAIVWTVDRDLVLTSASGAAFALLRMDPDALIGRPVSEALVDATDPAGIVAVHGRAIAGGSAHYVAELRDVSLRCHVEPLRGSEGEILGAIGVALDVTQATRLEKQLRHAMRMDSLGKLAGGIAHDFNNLLTVILSFTELAAADLGADHPVRPDLAQVTAAGERATQLVRQLLLFSRQQRTEPTLVSADQSLRALLPMFTRLLGEDVEIVLEHDAPLWQVRIDPTALDQVLVNLAVNARDAMPGGGKLVVEMRNVSLGEGLADGGAMEIAAGDHVVISVTDEGTGIAPDVLQRIFEPFFTTKDVGRGTGLGLSTVYGIVKEAGGAVHAYSEIGRGSTFRVFLPRAAAWGAVRDPVPESMPGGHETILVVEDEESVRTAAVRTLERLGYTVLEARDATAALEVVRTSGRAIDLLLTDVVMPGEDGPEVAAKIRASHPTSRVLFMSGYTERTIRARHPLLDGASVVEKPLRAGALARAVRKALDAG